MSITLFDVSKSKPDLAKIPKSFFINKGLLFSSLAGTILFFLHIFIAEKKS